MRRISAGTVTIGVIAILMGLGAAYVARQVLSRKAAEQETPSIVVAQVNLPKHTRIRSSDVRLVPLAPGLVPKPGMLTDRSVAVGRYVREAIEASDAIMEDGLFAIGDGPTLAELLPPGYRAVSVAVVGANASGGLVREGSIVDIALTVEGDHPELGSVNRRQGIGTKTLMQGIKVLAVDTRQTRSNSRSSGSVTLTTAVTPEQANKLILAQRFGTLSVTLVSSQEASGLSMDESEDSFVNPSSLGFTTAPAPEPPRTAVIYRGGSKQVVEFEPEQVAEAEEATLATLGRAGDGMTAAPKDQLPAGPDLDDAAAMDLLGISPPADRIVGQPLPAPEVDADLAPEIDSTEPEESKQAAPDESDEAESSDPDDATVTESTETDSLDPELDNLFGSEEMTTTE